VEKSEQRVVITFQWMKGLGARRIHTKLSRVLGNDCDSLAAIELWPAGFGEGDLSCTNHSRSSRPVIDISECLCAFLEKFPFASVDMMSKHFCIARGTIMTILQRDLALKRLSRRWVCHVSSAHHKKLITSIVLEPYCTGCNSHNRLISRE
jgi:hypothetical protein